MSTRIIPITVQDEYVIGSGVPVGSAGSGKDISLEITFSESWSEYSKRINWVDSRGGNATLTLLTDALKKPGETNVYIVPVPFGPKSYQGNMTVTIQGYVLDDEEIEQIQVSTTATFKVLPADWKLDDDGSVDATVAEQLQTAIEAKQDILTFDDTPTEDSENPVTSGGIYDFVMEETTAVDKVEIIDYGEPNATLWGQITAAYLAGKTVILKYSSAGSFDFYYMLTDVQGNPSTFGLSWFRFSCAFAPNRIEVRRLQRDVGGNYTWATEVSTLAPIASPTFTGNPKAPTPTAGSDSTVIATKEYVDAETARAMAAEATKQDLLTFDNIPTDGSSNPVKSGGVYSAIADEATRAQAAEALLAPTASPALTGTPTAPTPTSDSGDTQIATKKYVDDSVSPMLPKAGGTMTGAIAMGSNKITGLADPENDMDAATLKAVKEKVYDSLITESVTGNPVEITDGADSVPLKSALIKGKTAAVNQLVVNGDFSDGTTGWAVNNGSNVSIAVLGGVLNATILLVSQANRIERNIDLIPGHIYLVLADIKPPASTNVRIQVDGVEGFAGAIPANVWTNVSKIITGSNSTTNKYRIYFDTSAGLSSNDVVSITNAMCIDLSLIFTADELATIGTSVDNLKAAWLNKYGVPLPQYIPYNAGSIVSNNATYQLTGHNIWNEQWEIGDYDDTTGQPTTYNNKIRSKSTSPIPVKPNTTYCLYAGASRISVVYWYDANDAFISRTANADAIGTVTSPDNACYMRFKCADGYGTTYNNNLAINYPSTFTTYEPYYDGGSITADSLNGIGTVADEQDATGNITRRFGLVDLGTLTWTVHTYGKQSSSIDNLIRHDYGLDDIPNIVATAYTPISLNTFVSASRPANAITVGSDGRLLVTVDDTPSGYLVYELATPTTDTTTAATLTTQKGYNILRTVSGDIQSADATLEYRADVQLYIDKKIAEATEE